MSFSMILSREVEVKLLENNLIFNQIGWFYSMLVLTEVFYLIDQNRTMVYTDVLGFLMGYCHHECDSSVSENTNLII